MLERSINLSLIKYLSEVTPILREIFRVCYWPYQLFIGEDSSPELPDVILLAIVSFSSEVHDVKETPQDAPS